MADGTVFNDRGVIFRGNDDEFLWNLLNRYEAYENDFGKQKKVIEEFMKRIEEIQKQNDLNDAETEESKRRIFKKKSTSKPAKVFISSQILSRAIVLFKNMGDEWTTHVKELTKMGRPSDYEHIYTAIKVFLDCNMPAEAKNLFKQIKVQLLSFGYRYTRACLEINEKGVSEAKTDLEYCFNCDTVNEELQSSLIHVVGKDWLALRALDCLFYDMSVDKISRKDSFEYRLYEIYSIWCSGKFEKAKEMVDELPEHPYKHILRARMYRASNTDRFLPKKVSDYRMGMFGRIVKKSPRSESGFKVKFWPKKEQSVGNIDEVIDLDKAKKDLDKAIEEYSIVLNGDNLFFVVCELGETYLDAHKSDLAVMCFNRALKICSSSMRAWKGLVKAYHQKKDSEQANKAASYILDSELATVDDYLYCGNLLHELGFKEEVLHIVNTVLRSCPDHPQAHLLESKVHFKSGKYKSAVKSSDLVIKTKKCDSEIYSQLAEIRLGMGNVGKAEEYARNAVLLNSNSIHANLMAMEVYKYRGNMGLTEEFCRNVLNLDKENIIALRAMRDLDLKIDIDGSTDSIDVDRTLEDIRKALKNGEYAEVLKSCEYADSRFENNVDLLRYEGSAHYALKNYEKASESFLKAAEIAMKDPSLWHSKGLSDENISNYYWTHMMVAKRKHDKSSELDYRDKWKSKLKEAQDAFGKALLLDTDSAAYWNSYGFVMEKLGDDNGALIAYNHSIQLDPKEVFALSRKAIILSKHKKHKEADYFIDLAMNTVNSSKQKEDEGKGIVAILRRVFRIPRRRKGKGAESPIDRAVNLEAGDAIVRKTKMKILFSASMGHTDIEKIGDWFKKNDKHDLWTISCLIVAYVRGNDLSSAGKILKDENTTIRNILNESLDITYENEPIISARIPLLLAIAEYYSVCEDYDKEFEVRMKLYDMGCLDPVNYERCRSLLIMRDRTDEASKLIPPIEDMYISDNDDEGLYNLAVYHRSLGEFSKAHEYIDMLIKEHPRDEDKYIFKADLYNMSKNMKQAISTLEDFIGVNKESPMVLSVLGDYLLKTNEVSKAIDCYITAYNYAPKDSMCLKIADSYNSIKRTKEAMMWYRKVNSYSPNYAQAVKELAWLFYSEHDYDNAFEVLNDYRSENNEVTGDMYALYALIYGEKDDLELMEESYHNVIRESIVERALIEALVDVLNKKGRHTLAKPLQDRLSTSQSMDKTVLDCAVKMLETSIKMSKHLDDNDVLDSIQGFSDDILTEASNYLESGYYDEVEYGSDEFLNLEKQTYDLVNEIPGLRMDRVTVVEAYICMKPSIDDSKKLVDYVRKALKAELIDCPKELIDKSDEFEPGTTLEQIMEKAGLGIYQARMVLSEVNNRSSHFS
ncbi:MAG: hypothetical protein MJZ68_03795 [archaeon]|nr:hypothetical protein [archaeon]